MISVQIRIKNINTKRINGDLEKLHNQFTREAIIKTVTAMKGFAPVKSGALKNAIGVRGLSETKSGNIDRRFSLSVGSTVKHSGFVTRGTGPSPKRYVRAINKRVKSGTHPGTPVNTYVLKTALFMKDSLPSLGRAVYGRWAKSWKVIR